MIPATAKLGLIDKFDNMEVVRDQIAGILVLELTNQAKLAGEAGKDKRLWEVKVFTERTNPWSDYVNAPDDELDATPIINVWYDRASIDQKASNPVERQRHNATFNIDCYAYGVSKETSAGHAPGDQVAREASHRTVRLARNILMASEYIYLAMQGIVGKRMTRDISTLEAAIDARNVQQISALRLSLDVQYNEFSPQFTPEILEGITVEIKRKDFSGQIYLTAEYPNP